MSNKSTLKELLDKYKDGTIDAAELHRLELWLVRSAVTDHQIEPMELLSDLSSIRKGLQGHGLLRAKQNKVSRLRKLYPLAAAAVLLFVFGITAYYWQQDKQELAARAVLENVTGVVDGEEKAVLVLANGDKVFIDALPIGAAHLAEGGRIYKETSGLISFQSLNNAQSEDQATRKIQYQTLIVPKRSKLGLLLPDGSKVWLNAGSSLRFPDLFNSSERLVELDGEAYFEVVQQQDPTSKLQRLAPFIVKTAAQKIAVLGTRFNVSAYSEDPLSLSTLIEGRIQVTALASGKTNVLRPNQQSAISKEGALKIYTVDAAESNAWMEGTFLFSNENLETILKRISRWYDIEVHIAEDLHTEKIHFNGSVEKMTRLRDLLDILEMTKAVKFELKAGKLQVLKYN